MAKGFIPLQFDDMIFHRIHFHRCYREGKIRKSFLLGFCIFVFILFSTVWHRSFYIINEVEFTVWKTYRGCYIIPYKYVGALPPKDNYLRISNIGYADIFICKDKTLCVFIDPHSDGSTETVCKLKFCQYYSYSMDGKEELRRSRDWIKKWKAYQSIYPYITIDARSMKIEINE